MFRYFKYILILSCSVVVLSSCGGAEERKAAYLEKAKQSIEEGDLDKARIELKNVLQIDPKFAEAYFELGKIMEKKESYRKAFNNYRKAGDMAPDHLENQAKLGHFFLIYVRDRDKALEKRDFILAKEANNFHGLLLKAKILATDKEIDEAIVITEDLFKRKNDHVENAIVLATLYMAKERPGAAIKVLSKNLELTDNNDITGQLLAKIYLKIKDHKKAEAIFKRAVATKPNIFKRYVTLAAFYSSIDENEKAEQVFRDAINNKPEDVDRYLSLIKFLQATKGNEAAISATQKYIDNKPLIGELRVTLGRLYIVNKDFDSAKPVFEKTINDFPDDANGVSSRIALATIYSIENDEDKARKYIDDAVSISPNDSKVNLIRAKLAIKDKDYETAVLSLRITIKEAPETIEAYLLLAATHAALDEPEQGRSVIISAHENNRDNAPALLILAQYYTKLGDIVQTEKVIDDYLLINDSNYEALSLKVTLLNKKKSFDEAKVLAMRLVERHPDKANGYVYSIPYLASENDRDKAVALLKDGYANVSENTLILKLLTSMQVTMKNVDEAEKRIEEAITKSPEDAELHLLLAKIYISDNRNDKAESKLKEVIAIQSDKEEPYLLLSGIYSKTDKQQQAFDIIKQGTENATKSIRLPMLLARRYEADNNIDAVIDVYEKALLNHADNVILTNNLASTLSDNKMDEKSLNRAKELADKLKDSDKAVILDTVGWVYYKVNDFNASIEALKKVVAQEPEINIFNYHLGMAYKGAGDNANAKKYLNKSLSNGTDFNGKAEAEAAMKTL